MAKENEREAQADRALYEKVEGYCVKCRAKKVMKDAKLVTMRNGRLAAKGTCPDCGTGMFKFLPTDELQAEIEHGHQLVEIVKERKRALEQQAARLGSASPAELSVELDATKDTIQSLLEQLKELEARVQAIGEESPSDQTQVVDSGEVFTPNWSVLRSHVKYVDANLAYQFADASQEVNIMLGFATLFLGAALSFVASLIAAQNPSEFTLFGTSAGFSALLTVVFGLLARRAHNRLKEAKKQLLGNDQGVSPR